MTFTKRKKKRKLNCIVMIIHYIKIEYENEKANKKKKAPDKNVMIYFELT